MNLNAGRVVGGGVHVDFEQNSWKIQQNSCWHKKMTKKQDPSLSSDGLAIAWRSGRKRESLMPKERKEQMKSFISITESLTKLLNIFH